MGVNSLGGGGGRGLRRVGDRMAEVDLKGEREEGVGFRCS